jgi:hypothetical protein
MLVLITPAKIIPNTNWIMSTLLEPSANSISIASELGTGAFFLFSI